MSKKRASIIAASVLTAGLAIGGVTTGVVLANQPVNVTCYANNGTPAVTAEIKKGDNLNLPKPTREGYNFAGWYLDTGLTNQVIDNTKLKQNTKLYAGWELTNAAVLENASSEPPALAETQGLKSIGAYAFANSKLTSVTIPDTVTTIGERAFHNCQNLQTITIGKGVTTISSDAFGYCRNLKKINYNATACNDGHYLFYMCGSAEVGIEVVIGDNVTKIPAYLFADPENPSNIISVKIGKNVTSIGESAFEFCSKLTKIEIPESVTSIGSRAFQYCSSLAEINIPESVTIINSNVFNGCSSLTKVRIPSGVTSIGMCAFWNCSSLTSIFIPKSVTTFVNSNDYASFNKCSSSLQIYCEAESKPSSWGSRWNSNGSATLNVIWGASKLDVYSWSEIKEISDAGKASTMFKVGDEKIATLTDGTMLTIQIADFNHDIDINGKTIGMTFVTKETVSGLGRWNYSYGAANNSIRTQLNSTIYDLLPQELKNVITSAKKKTTSSSSSATTLGSEVVDNLFLLSLAEINYGRGKTDAVYKEEGIPYALFANWPENTDGYSSQNSIRIKHRAGGGQACGWWLRSSYIAYSMTIWCINDSGAVVAYATNNRVEDICFAFCV